MTDRFNKRQILKSDKYCESIDVLRVLLEESRDYSFEEIDNIINQYKDRAFTKGGEA